MALEEVVSGMSERTVKALLVVALTALAGVGAFGFSLEMAWRAKKTQDIQALEVANTRQDVDIRLLAASTDNLKDAVTRLSEHQESQAERSKKVDRLLDILERQVYNAKDKGGR